MAAAAIEAASSSRSGDGEGVERGAERREGGVELVAVLEEDVRPERRVRAGDAGHLPERRAGMRERGLVLGGGEHQRVRDRVGEVAREREHPVVRVGVGAHGARAERGDEALDELDALRARSRRSA